MIKRTIKPAAGNSRITVEEAMAAARVVYRDRSTGRLVVLGPGETMASRKAKNRAKGSSRREPKKR